jgi:hypothetical protein
MVSIPPTSLGPRPVPALTASSQRAPDYAGIGLFSNTDFAQQMAFKL